jgi:D-serine deaminase-like pyridoxal phosphate-dependent protein
VTAAALLCDYAQSNNITFKVMIELDVDNHRAGVDPHNQAVLDIAYTLNNSPFISLHGVMTHAGGSYNCFGADAQLTIARQERDLSLLAAKRIRDCGIACPHVSIGSTPTAFAIDDLSGITEVRAGVYAMFDLVMAGLGVCSIDDIAISVLGSIIGFQQEKNIALTDAGWMAMSRDRGTAAHEIDYGYGLICELNGMPMNGLSMQSANQEHGIIGPMSNVKTATGNGHGKKVVLNMTEHFKIGDFIRVLPNHACSTAGQFNEFYLVDGENVIASLPSISGW